MNLYNSMFLCYFFLFLFLVIGWTLNIIHVANMTFDVITGMTILRVIGIFIAPLGGILGYL